MRDNQVSMTAVKVARMLLYLDLIPRYAPLLPPRAASSTRALLEAGGLYRGWMDHLLGSPHYRRALSFVERHTVPGQTLEVGLRKRWIDDETRAAIEGGIEQLLVVGAGFDTLSLRIAEDFPGVSCFEVDHPATAGAKRRALDRLGPRPEGHHAIAVDLAKRSLRDVLAEASGWSRDQPAVVIAEGLLMYLSEAHVADFFRAVRAQAAPGTRVLFSYIERDARGALKIGRSPRLAQLGFRLIGESLRWGCATSELQGFLDPLGLRHVDDASCDLRARYLTPAGMSEDPLGEVERVAIAEVVR